MMTTMGFFLAFIAACLLLMVVQSSKLNENEHKALMDVYSGLGSFINKGPILLVCSDTGFFSPFFPLFCRMQRIEMSSI
jgi:hypothetical protein